MSTLGVVVFTIRGMKHLSDCLDSVRWADEVTVRNLEGNAVEGTKSSRQIDTDWVLHLWGEERVEADLTEELQVIRDAELRTEPSSYLIPIRTRVLGRWVRGSLWDPVPAPRLCRQENPLFGGWNLTNKINRGAPELRRGWIEDYSCAELSDGVEQLNTVSSLWADRLKLEGQSPSTVAMIIYPFRVLTQYLFLKGLFREGIAGLTLSVLAAYGTLASGMKLWESRQSGPRVGGYP